MPDLFTTIIKKFSNYNDPSGVASAKAGAKTVKEALDQTDPQRKSQVLPQFATQIQQILNIIGIMSMGSAGSGTGTVQQQPVPPVANVVANTANTTNVVSSDLLSFANVTANDIPTPVADTTYANIALGYKISGQVGGVITTGLANALAIESQNRGIQKVVAIMASVLNRPDYFYLLCQDYQYIITNAFNEFDVNLQQYGLQNYPIIVPPPFVPINSTDAVPSPIVNSVPDFYSEIFYANTTDPYPGYVTYQSIVDLNVFVYAVRTANDPPFADAVDNFTYVSQEAFADKFDPYIVNTNLSISTVATVMTDVITEVVEEWHNVTLGTGSQNLPLANNVANNVANNAGSGGGNNNNNNNNNNSNLTQQLLPWLQQMIQKAESEHLPKSVLDQGKIQQMLNQHGQWCAKGKMCQQLGQQALQPGAGGSGPTSDAAGGGS